MNDQSKRPSLRKAINDKCKSRIYDPHARKGAWRQQVEACTSYSCPLYPLRPTSKAGDGEKEAENGRNAVLDEYNTDTRYPSGGYIEKTAVSPPDSAFTV